MRISLIEVDLVDRFGVEFRQKEDCKQLSMDFQGEVPIGFKDWGKVRYKEYDFYMSSYDPPLVEEQEDDA